MEILTLDEIAALNLPERDLVDGLIAPSVTLVYGLPKAGKSTLLRTAVAGLSRGDATILGREAVGRPLKTLYIPTEGGALQETEQHLRELRADTSMVRIGRMNGEAPEATLARILDARFDLVVLDSLFGIVPGNISDNDAVAPMLALWGRTLTGRGVSFVVAHHQTRHGVNPAGSISIEALHRLIVRVTRPRKEANYFEAEAHGNRPGTHTYAFQVDHTSGTCVPVQLRRKEPREPSPTRTQRSRSPVGIGGETLDQTLARIAGLPAQDRRSCPAIVEALTRQGVSVGNRSGAVKKVERLAAAGGPLARSGTGLIAVRSES